MAIVKRLTKGSALTHAELDGNFTDLDTRVSTLESAPDSDSQTLTLVGTDLSISSGNTVDLSGLGGGAGGIALTDISVTSLAAAGSGTLTYDNTTGVFDYTPPDLSSFSTFDGDYNSLTNKPTIPSALTDLGIVDGTNGQVLTTDGAGSFTFTTVAGGTSYTDSDVDTHLNTSTATANQILSWDGADYAWVADQTGVGSSYGDADVATYLNGNLDSHIIPDTNATYDIGSAEYKIRHFYLSNNSMKFVDDTDPLNPVEHSLGVTNDYRLQYDGNSLKNTSTSDVADASTIDITKTNHFVTIGTTATLPNGTYTGQKLDFWVSAGGPGAVVINATSAIYMDGGGAVIGPAAVAWNLNNASQTLYSCIWNGVAWVLSHGGPGV